jgi:hypothetical protein
LPEAKARQRRSENRCVKRRALHSQGGTDIRQRLVRRLAAVIDHRPDPRNNIRRLILFLYAGSFPIGQLPKAKPPERRRSANRAVKRRWPLDQRGQYRNAMIHG